MKKTLLLVSLLAALQYGKAQTSHLKFDHFTVKDGLPNEEILFSKQDDQDMVVKGHGSIGINTKEGEYIELTVTLPLN